MKMRRDDPDETEGRAIYRYRADVQARFDINMATRKPRLRARPKRETKMFTVSVFIRQDGSFELIEVIAPDGEAIRVASVDEAILHLFAHGQTYISLKLFDSEGNFVVGSSESPRLDS